MLDREPFLKAIFADPDNDLPRLVFADYLEEQGHGDWARLIRVSCELDRFRPSPGRPPEARHLEDERAALIAKLPGEMKRVIGEAGGLARGFPRRPDRIPLHASADDLADPDCFRLKAVTDHPEWYGATRLKVTDGRILTPGPLETIFTSPVTEHVTELDLSGREVQLPVHLTDAGDPAVSVFDIEVRPVISVAMVEALAQTREARRLTSLDLTNNGLDNDAARALARSPHLFRLRRLYFHMGNHLRARTWQGLIDRFGTDVVQ